MEAQPTKPEKSNELNTDLEKMGISNSDDGEKFDSDDSFPDIECDLCCKEFSSVKMYEQHLNSKKHQQMLTKRKLKQKVGKLRTQNGQISDTNGEDIHLEADDSAKELSCEICSKNFSGYIPYATHLKSNVHSKNLKKQSLKDQMKDLPEVIGKDEQGNKSDEDDILQKPFAQCTPCNKVFYDPSCFQQHMKGTQHKKKMQGTKTLESLKSQMPDSEKFGDEDEEIFSKCDVCHKSFSGPVPYKIHLHSSVHQKELKRAKIEDELKDFFTKDAESQKLVCTECKKTFTDPFSFKGHLETNSHDKQKAKDAVFDFVASYPDIVAVKSVQNLSSDEENDDVNYRNGSYFFVCKLCHLSFSGPESVRDHVQSKKHTEIKKEKEGRKILQIKMKEKKSKDNSMKRFERGDNSANTDASNNSAVDTSVELSKKLPDESEMNDDFELI